MTMGDLLNLFYITSISPLVVIFFIYIYTYFHPFVLQNNRIAVANSYLSRGVERNLRKKSELWSGSSCAGALCSFKVVFPFFGIDG